ncbi:MAG TPA: alpha/beta hydrolase, partial [Candidatus Saccharimonadia bacterium]|nr:alpha/beta hydrolase [Candidatus Saccharimonadia bacterium]
PGVLAQRGGTWIDPASVMVTMDTGVRIHVLDWADSGSPKAPTVVLVHGLLGTAWIWSPIVRRVAGRARVLAPDLRGHGLSESPRDGYDLDSLAFDLLTVLTAHDLGPDVGGPPVILAGHGFGAQVVAWAAHLRPAAIAGLILVDGGWEELESALRIGPAEFQRGLDEPPEVLASMDAFLADRRDWDPDSWDADQERAARATVDEKYAGRVVPIVRRHALSGCVAAMFAYDPAIALGDLVRSLTLLVAEPGGADDDDVRERRLALEELLAIRRAAGMPPDRVVPFAGSAHNLMRYRPDEVSASILDVLAAPLEAR